MLDEIKDVIRILTCSKWVFLFISIVMLDIAVGTVKSFILGVSSSRVGLKGLLKHSVVFITTIIVTMFMILFDLEGMAKTWLIYYIVQYMISLVESWGELGLPLPDFIKDKIYKLNDVTNTGGMSDDYK